MNVCLVGSMRNYDRIMRVAKSLKEAGHSVTSPMDVSEGKFGDKQQEKANFIRGMYEAMKGCDNVLAVNDEERATYKGYIGPNTFLQLGMGFALGKTLFCLETWDSRLPYNDELRAMGIKKLDIQVRF